MGKRRFGSVRKLSSGRWQARYPDDSGRLVPAPETFERKGDADRYLAAVETDRTRGVLGDPRGGEITFAEWVEIYRASNPKRATTAARDAHVLRTHLLPALGAKPLAKITRLDVRRLVDSMAERLAPATVRTDFGVLKAVLNAAVDAEVIWRSPCRGVRLPSARPPDRRTLTPAELVGLAEAMAPRYRAIVYLAGVLGLRWSEIAGLRIGDVDVARATITVSSTLAEVNGKLIMDQDTKSSHSHRLMAVPAFVMEILAAHLADRGVDADQRSALVFAAPQGGPLRATNFRVRIWGPAVRAAGLDGLTLHGLRHVAASLMVDTGEPARVLQHRLGHSSARLSLERYAHVSDAADRAAAARLDDLFRGASEAQGGPVPGGRARSGPLTSKERGGKKRS